ncbi:MAG: glycine/sarcosine/betaine reductase selenoprotein B family protein [Hyphomicrobiaceae bacterium]|nr:glycine/sarcosine/betaine reductase selenoprotein B family protein [Hyphomicrobiaceae bacterium]
MEPIRYVDTLAEKYGALGFPPYDWSRFDDAPLTPLGKPLSACVVSLLTSGGVSRCGMPPFQADARNDLRLDSVAPDAPSNDFRIHDSYYDHADADVDLNCVFPIDRLRELAAAGEIGAVAPRLWSGFMGRIYKRQAVLQDKAPALAEMLRADGVDLLVAVPA